MRGEPRQLVLELCQLHLEAPLVGSGVLGEDVEDQAAPVNDLDLQELLEGALLARDSSSSATRTLKPVSAFAASELLSLALAHVPVGVNVVARFCHSAPTTSAPAVSAREASSGKAVLGVPAGVVAGVDGDEEHLLDGRSEIDRGGSGHGREHSRRDGARPRARDVDLRRRGPGPPSATSTHPAPCPDPSSETSHIGPATARPWPATQPMSAP